MKNRLLPCVCAALTTALLAPAVVHAKTFNVNTTTDQAVTGGCTTDPSCSLRDAIDAANADTTDPSDTVNVPAGTYTLSQGELPVDDSVAINGAGARTTTIDANHASRIFDIADGDVSISGLTMTNGSGVVGGATIPFFEGDGGAILLGSFGTFLGCGCSPNPHLTLTDSAVTGNSATLNGGGIGTATFESPDFSNIAIVRSTISDNQVTGGTGGGFGGGIESFGVVTITNSTISGNSVSNASATNQGGGIAVGVDPSVPGGSSATILNSTIAGNSVTGSAPGGMGGGLAASSSSSSAPLDVKNTIVAGNTVDGAPADCSGVTTITTANNLSSDASCGFTDAGSLPSTDPSWDRSPTTAARPTPVSRTRPARRSTPAPTQAAPPPTSAATRVHRARCATWGRWSSRAPRSRSRRSPRSRASIPARA